MHACFLRDSRARKPRHRSCGCGESFHASQHRAENPSQHGRGLHYGLQASETVSEHVLLLHKALEGIPEGARLWFQHNKWALNKCGLGSELCEPNLYTIKGLSVIIAVFADDVGAGFKDSERPQYLKIRAEYSKLIKIDCTSPFSTLPIELFTGVNIKRDRKYCGHSHNLSKAVLR